MSMNIYKEGTRKGIIFSSGRGLLNIGDIWHLSLDELDDIYKSLNKTLKESDEDSLLSKPTKGTAELRLKFELIKDVMLTKLEEAEDAKNAIKDKERTQYLLSLKVNNQQERDSEMTDKEIDKELRKLSK